MRAQSVLVIEPDSTSATLIDQVLRAAGVYCRVVSDAEAGWRAFAAEAPRVVLTALTTPRRDGAWFLRRIRDAYLGQLPGVYALVHEEEITPSLRELDVDGVLLKPLGIDGLLAACAHDHDEEPPTRQASRLRELFELSLLSGDVEATLKNFIDRVVLAFRASDGVLWGPPHEDRWPKTRRPLTRPEDQALLLWRCDLAVTCGTTLIAVEGAGQSPSPVVEGGVTRSFLAASLDAPGAQSLGALCLVTDTPHRFSAEERDTLRALARRVAIEMAWRSAHDRLAIEHDRLRETSLLDPLLGIWTRAALEESMAAEMERARRTGEVLAVAVLDFDQLRQVNERHGHVAGDELLAHVAGIVRASLRPQDLLGRIAGDELGIMLVGVVEDEARSVLEGVKENVRRAPLKHHGMDIATRVTLGATHMACDETAPEEALGRATAALKQAKRGRVAVSFLERGAPLEGPHSGADTKYGASDILPPGTTLGGMYQVLHEISRGAMGVVYRAEDLGLGRPVAVKVLRPDLARDAELVSRFRQEAAMLAALRHENLVQVHAFGTQGDDVYFVMELVEGEALSEILARADEAGEPLPVDLVGAIVLQVAGALDAMHRAGAVHRDVKPANILLDRVRDRAVLVDVGVAKRQGTAAEAAGTPGFAAPESFTAGVECAATDVYGLAATAYMVLTGLAPFGGGDIAKVVRRQLQDRPAAPSSLRGDLPQAVDRVIARALSPSPLDRHGSAQEFAHALGHALREMDSGTPAAPARDSSSPFSPGNELRHSTRRLTRPIALTDEPLLPESSAGNTRGALFRVAYKILGNRLGSAWVRRACEQDPRLSEVLRPTVAPMGWYPVERLIALLHAVPAGVRDPRKVARELGRAAMTATFNRFFGADLTSLSPAEVLGATTVFWTRYHSWGLVTVEASREGAVLTIADTPREPLVCSLIEGSFERIAELAGATSVTSAHGACEANGAEACAFEVRWAAS
ncbi:MAG: diguanylate cyclase [Deltaproteobacteria bacterium]|nr:diguanylate cyclase [Deltaproteobacteria bacterium]